MSAAKRCRYFGRALNVRLLVWIWHEWGAFSAILSGLPFFLLPTSGWWKHWEQQRYRYISIYAVDAQNPCNRTHRHVAYERAHTGYAEYPSRKCTLVEMLLSARPSRFRNSQQQNPLLLPPPQTHTHSKNSSAHCLHRLNRCRALNAVLSFLPSKSSTHKIRAVCVGFRRFCRWTLRTLLLASDASTDTVAYKLDGFARDINQDTVNSWTVNTYQLHQSEWRISGIILSKPQPICP